MFRSHPSWVCELKHLLIVDAGVREWVTPFVGVWIETIPCVVATSTVPSHPLWVCGLKLGYLLVTPCSNRGTCINLCLGIDVSRYGVLFYVPILTHLFESFSSFRVKLLIWSQIVTGLIA